MKSVLVILAVLVGLNIAVVAVVISPIIKRSTVPGMQDSRVHEDGRAGAVREFSGHETGRMKRQLDAVVLVTLCPILDLISKLYTKALDFLPQGPIRFQVQVTFELHKQFSSKVLGCPSTSGRKRRSNYMDPPPTIPMNTVPPGRAPGFQGRTRRSSPMNGR